MPLKRNPVALARIRALAGQSVGWLPAQHAMKSPTSSDCDAFYVSAGGDLAFGELVDVVALGAEVIRGMQLYSPRCEQALEGTWTTLSGLADTLVRHGGIDFRSAHDVVGELARLLREFGRVPGDATPADVSAAARSVAGRHLEISAERIRNAVNPQAFARSRTSAGGTALAEIRAMFDAAGTLLRSRRDELDTRFARVSGAEDLLRRACDALARPM